MIAMDQLREDQAQPAMLNRLTRLHTGEQVELPGHRDPHPIWLRLQERDPGGHSWEATQDNEHGWSVTICRRDHP